MRPSLGEYSVSHLNDIHSLKCLYPVNIRASQEEQRDTDLLTIKDILAFSLEAEEEESLLKPAGMEL